VFLEGINMVNRTIECPEIRYLRVRAAIVGNILLRCDEVHKVYCDYDMKLMFAERRRKNVEGADDGHLEELRERLTNCQRILFNEELK